MSCVNTNVAATHHSHEKRGQRKCRKLLIKKSNCTKTVLKRNTIKQNDNAVVSGFFLKTNKSIFKKLCLLTPITLIVEQTHTYINARAETHVCNAKPTIERNKTKWLSRVLVSAISFRQFPRSFCF